MGDTQSPEQVAGARIREIRITRNLTQAALAKAMKALGYNWLQTTIAKVEAAERPLRINEATDLATVLGVEVSYLLGPPLKGRLAASKDFREVIRLQETLDRLQSEHIELEQQIIQKTEELRRTRRAHTEACERLEAAGAVIDDQGYWQFPEDTDGER